MNNKTYRVTEERNIHGELTFRLECLEAMENGEVKLRTYCLFEKSREYTAWIEFNTNKKREGHWDAFEYKSLKKAKAALLKMKSIMREQELTRKTNKEQAYTIYHEQ